MNRDPIPALLATVLLLSVTVTAGLCLWFLQTVRHQQAIQEDVKRVNANRALMQSLAADCSEYARKNPAIMPVLQNLGFRGSAGASRSQPSQPNQAQP